MLNKKGITKRTAANVPLVVSEVIETIHLERAVMVKFFEAHLNHMLGKGSPKNSDHAGYFYDQLCKTSEQNTLANNSTKAVALMKQQLSAPPIARHIYDGK